MRKHICLIGRVKLCSIKRNARSLLSGSLVKRALEFTGLFKGGDSANRRNDSGRLTHPNWRHGKEDLPFSTGAHEIYHFCLKDLQMMLNEPEFFDKQPLLQEKTMVPISIFVSRKILSFSMYPRLHKVHDPAVFTMYVFDRVHGEAS